MISNVQVLDHEGKVSQTEFLILFGSVNKLFVQNASLLSIYSLSIV